MYIVIDKQKDTVVHSILLQNIHQSHDYHSLHTAGVGLSNSKKQTRPFEKRNLLNFRISNT